MDKLQYDQDLQIQANMPERVDLQIPSLLELDWDRRLHDRVQFVKYFGGGDALLCDQVAQNYQLKIGIVLVLQQRQQLNKQQAVNNKVQALYFQFHYNQQNMSDQFPKRFQQTKQTLSQLKKDIRYREDQSKKGQTTFQTDAQIKGNFTTLEDNIQKLNKLVLSYQSISTKIPPKEIERRKNIYNDVVNERDNLKKRYDSFFEKKTISPVAFNGNETGKFTDKYQTTNLNTRQLDQLRTHELNQQDEALDGLIGAVQGIKTAGHAMGKEFDEQKVMLDTLETGVDKNTEKMGRVRGNMMKLLESSSNWCLGGIIILEIAAVICILVIWR